MSVFLQRMGLLSATGVPAGPITYPPIYGAWSNVKFLSKMNSNPIIDESDAARTFTTTGDAAPDAGQTVFGQSMTQFDGDDDRIYTGTNADFNPAKEPFAGFMYIKTPSAWVAGAGGSLMTYLGKDGVQWKTYWDFSVGDDGKLSFPLWTGTTGGGYTAFADTVALDVDTLYLVGFSHTEYLGTGHYNRKIFGGKVGVDAQCVVRAQQATDNACNANNLVAPWPDFALGASLQDGVLESDFVGHIGEAFFIKNESYVVDDFDMPTTGWYRADVVVDPGAHRYWRVQGITNQGNIRWTLAEVEFRSSVGGADQTGSGTVIKSQDRSGFLAANAFDNSSTTDWSTPPSPTYPVWIGYDFGDGNDIKIVETALTARSDGGYESQTIHNWMLEYSDDGTNWTRAAAFFNTVNYGAGETKVFTNDYT